MEAAEAAPSHDTAALAEESSDEDDMHYAHEDDGDDGGDALRYDSEPGPDTAASRWLRDGGEQSLNADLAGLAAHGYKGAWRVSTGSEICVVVEVPYSRFGISKELAHSLRLEPGCVVVVKLRAQVGPDSCVILLHPGPDHRLPVLRFTVLKAKPGMLSEILQQQGKQDAELVKTRSLSGRAEFGLRYSLQNTLQSFFVQMLAVENGSWHKPHAYAESCSLAYVRNCVNKGLDVESDRYMNPESSPEKDEALNAAIAESRSGPRSAFMHTETREMELARTNQLLRLARFVRQELELASQYCLVCHVPTPVRGIKPFVCASPLCLHQWQELSLGANPELEVEQNPEVVDLLLSLFYQYAVSTEASVDDGLLPTWSNIKGWVPCSGTLRNGMHVGTIEGEGTYFKAQVLQGDCIRVAPVSPDGRRLAEQTRKVKSVDSDDSLTLEDPFSCPLENVSFHRLRESDEALWDVGFAAANIIDGTPLRVWCSTVQQHASSLKGSAGGMPAVASMRDWVVNGENLRSKLDGIDGRLYPLLRWVLCSMRGHLRYVQASSRDEIIPQLQEHFTQFVLRCSKPETEATFQELKKSGNEVKYAFHGSPCHNWHSILRNGLNFKKTTNGRAFGNGIYMATNAATSLGYSHNASAGRHVPRNKERKGTAAFARHKQLSSITENGWTAQSMFKSAISCMAVCEVIYRPDEFVSTHPHWVIDQQDWVVTRYLCVPKHDGEQPPWKHRKVNVQASSLTINMPPVVATTSSTSFIGGAARESTSAVGDSTVDHESTQIDGLCQMFPQFESSMIQSVLLSVNSDTGEAVLVLSSMAASAPCGNDPGRQKRGRDDCTGDTVVDLTGPELHEATQTVSSDLGAPTSRRAAAPSSSQKAIDEVLSGAAAMGLELTRSDAMRLLKAHHWHVSDALGAAFG